MPLNSALKSMPFDIGLVGIGDVLAIAESVMPVKEKTMASTAIHMTEAVGTWLSLFFL